MEEKAFCMYCEDFVSYHVNQHNSCFTFHDKKYNYMEKSAYCDKCKFEIYVPEINDENVDRRQEIIKRVRKYEENTNSV